VEFAPLRPVPLAPAGPVDPERALGVVATHLPELGTVGTKALALVLLAGRDRTAAAAELGVDRSEVAAALTAARTALRQSVRPLAGSGWCRRAEALVSDRLDGELDERGAARLDVHLRNCPRCDEHERRLIQAQNALIATLGRAPTDAGPAELTLVPPAPSARPATPESLASIVAVASGVLVLLAALLVIAAIVFSLVALLGI
jgi:Putative zinc-finger